MWRSGHLVKGVRPNDAPLQTPESKSAKSVHFCPKSTQNSTKRRTLMSDFSIHPSRRINEAVAVVPGLKVFDGFFLMAMDRCHANRLPSRRRNLTRFNPTSGRDQVTGAAAEVVRRA